MIIRCLPNHLYQVLCTVLGAACHKQATIPATSGQAKEVPVSGVIYPLPDTTFVGQPYAITSGSTRLSAVGPIDESSSINAVWCNRTYREVCHAHRLVQLKSSSTVHAIIPTIDEDNAFRCKQSRPLEMGAVTPLRSE